MQYLCKSAILIVNRIEEKSISHDKAKLERNFDKSGQ